MKPTVYVVKEHVGDFERDELDFDLHSEFGFDYDECQGFVELTKGRGQVDDTAPIKIDDLLSIITELKSRGATHVCMDYHVDHIGYEFSGYRIELAEPAMVQAYEETQKREYEKRLAIQKLKAEIAALEHEDLGNTKIEDSDDLPF